MAFVHLPHRPLFLGIAPQSNSSFSGCRLSPIVTTSSTASSRSSARMIFGFGKKKSAANPSSSGTNPYRALGVTEDATYDDIEAAVKRLSIKYADDRKKLMMLDVYKDKIFEDKLQQRMSGALQPKIKESPYERKLEPKKRFVVPVWLQDTFLLPERKYVRKTGIIMGIFMVLSFVTPSLAGSCIAMGFIAAAGFLYNRGLPEPVRDDYGGYGEVRPVRHKAVLKTVLINLAVAAVFFGLAQLYLLYGPLPLWCPPDAFVSVCVVLGLWVSCLLFMAQDPNDLY